MIKKYTIIFLLACLCFIGLGSFSEIVFANNAPGLHLQLPNKDVVIKMNEIEEHLVIQTGKNTTSIMIRLKAAPAARLRRLTEDLVGKPALWVWNGRVITVEKLVEPISYDFTVHNFTPFEAEDFEKQK